MATKLTIKELLTRKNPPVVQPGKYENVVIKHYELAENGEYEYVRFTYELPNGNTISENRFPQGLSIMISHMREQLSLQDIEISGEELFEPGKHKFTIWVEQKQLKDKFTGEITGRVTNISFLEPLNNKPAETETEKPAETATQAEPTETKKPTETTAQAEPTEADIPF